MIDNWEDYYRELEIRKNRIIILENKLKQNNDRGMKNILHDLRNEITIWSINTYMDIEEKELK